MLHRHKSALGQAVATLAVAAAAVIVPVVSAPLKQTTTASNSGSGGSGGDGLTGVVPTVSKSPSNTTGPNSSAAGSGSAASGIGIGGGLQLTWRAAGLSLAGHKYDALTNLMAAHSALVTNNKQNAAAQAAAGGTATAVGGPTGSTAGSGGAGTGVGVSAAGVGGASGGAGGLPGITKRSTLPTDMAASLAAFIAQGPKINGHSVHQHSPQIQTHHLHSMSGDAAPTHVTGAAAASALTGHSHDGLGHHPKSSSMPQLTAGSTAPFQPPTTQQLATSSVTGPHPITATVTAAPPPLPPPQPQPPAPRPPVPALNISLAAASTAPHSGGSSGGSGSKSPSPTARAPTVAGTAMMAALVPLAVSRLKKVGLMAARGRALAAAERAAAPPVTERKTSITDVTGNTLPVASTELTRKVSAPRDPSGALAFPKEAESGALASVLGNDLSAAGLAVPASSSVCDPASSAPPQPVLPAPVTIAVNEPIPVIPVTAVPPQSDMAVAVETVQEGEEKATKPASYYLHIFDAAQEAIYAVC